MREQLAVFVMIKCELGRAYDVAAKIMDDLEETREVYSISGEYDLLTQFRLPVGSDVGHYITSKVQTIAGVRDTFSILAFNAFT